MAASIANAIVALALCSATKLAAQTSSNPTPSSVDDDVAALFRSVADRAGVRSLTGPEADTIRFEFRAFRFNHAVLRPALVIRAQLLGYQGYRIEPPSVDKTLAVKVQPLGGDWSDRVRLLESILLPSSPVSGSSRTLASRVSADGAGLAIEWRRGSDYRVWFIDSELSACPSPSDSQANTNLSTIEAHICAWLDPFTP